MAIDTTSLRTRRAILLGALGGVAASIAGAVGQANPVSATDGDIVRVGNGYSATTGTRIHATDANGFVATSNTAVGLFGQSDTGTGVYGESASGSAVWGYGFEGEGVTGFSQSSHGVGGYADADDKASVYGEKRSNGPAVGGRNLDNTNGWAAVYGYTNGTGPGTFGENVRAGNGASGVARGTGSGVYGQSDHGRGGTFVGQKAQVRLQPSAAISHPSSGQPGDLFVDKNRRLWFCKGGPTWVKLA